MHHYEYIFKQLVLDLLINQQPIDLMEYRGCAVMRETVSTVEYQVLSPCEAWKTSVNGTRCSWNVAMLLKDQGSKCMQKCQLFPLENHYQAGIACIHGIAVLYMKISFITNICHCSLTRTAS